MLFDVYFNLLSFYLGLCAGFSHLTKADYFWHACGIVVGGLSVVLFWWLLRKHLRAHAVSHEWPKYRRFAPLLSFLVGLAIIAGPAIVQNRA